MQPGAADLPVILVGGGSILIGRPIQGASEVIKPDHFAVANAIGVRVRNLPITPNKVLAALAERRNA